MKCISCKKESELRKLLVGDGSKLFARYYCTDCLKDVVNVLSDLLQMQLNIHDSWTVSLHNRPH